MFQCFRNQWGLSEKWGSLKDLAWLKTQQHWDNNLSLVMLIPPRWPMCCVLPCEVTVNSADSERWRKWPEMRLQLRWNFHSRERQRSGNSRRHGPAFIDEHLPSMWRWGEKLMGGHGRLVPVRSRSFLLMLDLAWSSSRKEMRKKKLFFLSLWISNFSRLLLTVFVLLCLKCKSVLWEQQRYSQSVTELHWSRLKAEIFCASGN